jgi:hypothetical protein
MDGRPGAFSGSGGKIVRRIERAPRIEEILERTTEPSPERLRSWRATKVLEQIASPEARRVLQSLAAGAPEARMTREAKAALKRQEIREGQP